MKNSKELLIRVLKTAQTSQASIRSALDSSMCPALRTALESHLWELGNIENEAYSIASQRGWDLPELDPAMRFLSDRMIRMKLGRGSCDSKIAALVILNDTKSMVNGTKELHRYPHPEDRISCICQKLLDSETANIRQMQLFL